MSSSTTISNSNTNLATVGDGLHYYCYTHTCSSLSMKMLWLLLDTLFISVAAVALCSAPFRSTATASSRVETRTSFAPAASTPRPDGCSFTWRPEAEE